MNAPEPLTQTDLEVLAFERTPWRYPGKKESAVMERFGWSLTRYYQRLNKLLDHPDALAYDPLLVRRLRRRRQQRIDHRTDPTRRSR